MGGTLNFYSIFFVGVVISLKKLPRTFWAVASGRKIVSGPFEKWLEGHVFGVIIHRARSCTVDYHFAELPHQGL